jgi:hypothetical protein
MNSIFLPVDANKIFYFSFIILCSIHLISIDFSFVGAQQPHKYIHIDEHSIYFLLIYGYQCLSEEKKHSEKG